MENGITWGGLLAGPFQHWLTSIGVEPESATDATIAAAVLILVAWASGRAFRKVALLEPDGKVSIAFVTETVIARMLAFFGTIIHHGVRRVFVLLATFTLFILFNNLLGLIPGFDPPTDQFNVTIALALITFVTAHYLGIREHGWGYIKKFLGPVWWIAPLIFPIELISHLVRPLSLAMRLFGNMTGDHKVVAVFTMLLPLGLPIPFMGLGIFVSFLQAFVFVLLSAVYFQDALDHPH